MENFDQTYASEYSQLANKAMQVGWHLPIYISKSHHSDLEEILDSCDAREQDEALFRFLRGYVLHPLYMARISYIWFHKSKLKMVSHLVDEAVCCLYSGQYSSAATSALVAIEGAFRRVTGKTNVDKNALEALRKLPLECLEHRGEAYRENLISFLAEWLFVGTRNPAADFTMSGLNRHNLVHGVFDGRSISERDSLRALLACELFAEFERCRTGEDHTLYPDDDHQTTYTLLVGNYSEAYLQLANRRDMSRVCSLDSQLPGRGVEEPFGTFQNDFDEFAFWSHNKIPQVEQVRQFLKSRKS